MARGRSDSRGRSGDQNQRQTRRHRDNSRTRKNNRGRDRRRDTSRSRSGGRHQNKRNNRDQQQQSNNRSRSPSPPRTPRAPPTDLQQYEKDQEKKGWLTWFGRNTRDRERNRIKPEWQYHEETELFYFIPKNLYFKLEPVNDKQIATAKLHLKHGGGGMVSATKSVQWKILRPDENLEDWGDEKMIKLQKAEEMRNALKTAEFHSFDERNVMSAAASTSSNIQQVGLGAHTGTSTSQHAGASSSTTAGGGAQSRSNLRSNSFGPEDNNSNSKMIPDPFTKICRQDTGNSEKNNDGGNNNVTKNTSKHNLGEHGLATSAPSDNQMLASSKSGNHQHQPDSMSTTASTSTSASGVKYEEGIVLQWHEDRGFGFISHSTMTPATPTSPASQQTQTLFVHRRNIVGSTSQRPINLPVNIKVIFTIGEDSSSTTQAAKDSSTASGGNTAASGAGLNKDDKSLVALQVQMIDPKTNKPALVHSADYHAKIEHNRLRMHVTLESLQLRSWCESWPGKKQHLQDRFCLNQALEDIGMFFGVFDGHGGVQVADLVSDRLWKHLLSHYKQRTVLAASRDEKLLQSHIAAYLQCDAEICEVNYCCHCHI
ncbi:unnamed protein product, partial [Amoebophrya sp. A120]|eukprot:GSA120T00026197001.1